MGSQEVLESVRVSNNSVTSCGDGLEQLGSENLGVDILEDLDSYWEDISDRLMISRVVSDSVIKGMVNAVEQQAAERIAVKESELAGLKESLQFFHVGANKTRHEPESLNYAQHLSCADACVEHDRMSESLSNMRNNAREQFKRLKQEIDEIRGSSSLRRIGSGCESIGLGGILKEKETENWVGLDRTVDGLNVTMDTICTQLDDILAFSKASRQEEQFQREVEAIVMQSSIRTLQEELEEKLWDQKARFCGSQTVNWVEKFDEISNLRKELDAVLKLLSNPESGQLISYGSCDTDHSLRMTFGNHTSFTPSLWEGNGKVDESKTGVPENFDAAQFNHMTNKELVNFFNLQITKMKRDHESTVQQMTEEYISLKGKYLNQRGSSLPLRRDKEFDMLKKKIPDVILKLDDIIGENEKLPAFSENAECLGSLKERLDSLLLENRQLRDSLADKKNEVKCLSSQVIDAAEKKMQHSLAEANMLKSATHLSSIMEDAIIEASVRDEVNKCVLRELSGQIRTKAEESEMEFIIMQEIFGIIYGESAHKNDTTVKCEIEDSDMESMIMQEICGIIFRQTIKDAEGQCEELYKEYLVENGRRVSLEMEVLEREKKIRLEFEEKEGFKQKVLLLTMSKEEKEQQLTKVSAALMKEKEQFDLASLEINELRDQTKKQEMSLSESNKELDLVKGKLGEALEQIDVHEMEVNFLHQKLELAAKDLKKADEQRNMFIALTQEKQNDLSLFKAKEKEHCKQMEAVIVLVEGLSKKLSNFECRVAELIKSNSTRLEHSRSQLNSLINKATILAKTGLMYKQSLERRSSDLQMAEDEVDLLGDEVEALLGLLEKIYIALDHYSPILQHYPGIIEILKLVRRELSEAPTKAI